MKEMRGHACWYIQGIPYSNRMKDRINQMTTYAEFESMLKLYEEALVSGNFDGPIRQSQWIKNESHS